MTNPRKTRRWSRSGLTLIELLVVLVIVGIISAIAAPSFSNFRSEQRSYDAAQAVNLEIKRLRYRAQSLNRAVGFVINSGAGQFWHMTSATNQCAGLAGAPQTLSVEVTRMYPGITFMDVNGSSAWLNTLVCIRPSGQVINPITSQPFVTGSSVGVGGTISFFLGRDSGLGTPYEIRLPYNGIARLN